MNAMEELQASVESQKLEHAEVLLLLNRMNRHALL